MKPDEIKKKISELKDGAQKRVDELAKSDPLWCNIQGQIGAYEAVLKEEPAKGGE